jgi:endo-1,4-beta-xylanase
MKRRTFAFALSFVVLTGSAAVHIEAASAASGLKIETFATGNIGERRSGSIQVPNDGMYTFYVNGKASDLWVDGVHLLDWWQNDSYERTARLMLSTGVKHDFLLQIVPNDRSGASAERIEWSGPGVPRQEIPTSALSPDRGTEPGLPVNASLKDLGKARGVFIGAAVQLKALQNDTRYRDLLHNEFSLAPPEYAFGNSFDRDASGRPIVDPTPIDPLVADAYANGQQSQAFHLLWYQFGQFVPWLGQLSKPEQAAYAKVRVQTLVRRYQGRIQAYVVVNEALTDNGILRPDVIDDNGTQYGNWLNFSPTAIEDSFRWAREADPNALLFYNDYDIENDGPKWDATLALAKDLHAKGLLDGVGFQAHLRITEPIYDDQIREHFRQLNALGIQVRITELDVMINNAPGTESERLNEQANYYWRMTDFCVKAANCDAVNMWSVSDQYSWRTNPLYGAADSKPTIFDSNYQPKQAYWAMNHALRRPE